LRDKETGAPGLSWQTILDVSSRSPVSGLRTLAVEYKAMIERPFLLFWAPIAVSLCRLFR
jgi:hypothetical protein